MVGRSNSGSGRQAGTRHGALADSRTTRAPVVEVGQVLQHITQNSRIEFHTALLPDNLRGAGLQLVIIDEAADVSEYAWRSVIRPMLITTQGEALLLGTPRGHQNWLHEMFLRGQTDTTGQYASIRLPTSANPLVSLDELHALRAEMTDVDYRQEIDAEFIAASTPSFPTFTIAHKTICR
jgi:hypothetical protein